MGRAFTSVHIWLPAAVAQTPPGLSRVKHTHHPLPLPKVWPRGRPIYGTESKKIWRVIYGDPFLRLQTICSQSHQQTQPPWEECWCFSRHVGRADGEAFWNRKLTRVSKTLKHQQFTEHLVGEGLRIEGDGGGCRKLLNNNFILRQMKINCRGAQRKTVKHRGYSTVWISSVADILLLQPQSKLSQAITQYKSEWSLIDCIGMKTEEKDCLNNPYLAKPDVEGPRFAWID